MSDTTSIYLLPAVEGEVSPKDLPPGEWQRIPGTADFSVRLPQSATPASVRFLFRRLSYQEAKHLCSVVTLKGDFPKGKLLAAAVGGMLLGSYRADKWKTARTKHPLEGKGSKVGSGKASKKLKRLIRRERILASVQKRVMELVDTPANFMRPQHLAAWALRSGNKYGYQVKVLDADACHELGMGALLAVNRGSEDAACLIVAEYRGTGAESTSGPVAIVGKGVTFDTGGVSIKPSAKMHLMKADMGGAAAALGTLEAAARLALPVHLVGVIPVTDNSVDALSIKPSEVVTGYGGKSIEILNTDAEGRLILSDGLSYAIDRFKPAILLDIATLTGSAFRTFGHVCAAMISCNESLVRAFGKAGEACGEKVWPLPGWDDFDALQSDVADIRNYSGQPLHGAIDAFKFLEFFTEGHPAFVHFDIAGTAQKPGPFARDPQATGFGIRLFIEWLDTAVCASQAWDGRRTRPEV